MVAGSDSRQVKAILYDLDGVITDTRKWHYEALNVALAKFNFYISPQEQKQIYEGLPTVEKLKILTEKQELPEALYSEIVKNKYDEIAIRIERHCAPDPKITGLIKKVNSLGIKQVLCTNTTKSTVEVILAKMQLIDLFDFYLTRQDIVLPKPDPEIFFRAMGKLELDPGQCLIVEDSDHGMHAAKLTGAKVLRCKNHDWLTFEKLSKHLS